MSQRFLKNITYQIETIPDPFDEDYFLSILSKNERTRFIEMQNDLRKKQFLYCRYLLKRKLSEKLNLAHEKIEISISSEGKPLPFESWHISLSHSENLCGIALAQKNIGFDLQKKKRLLNLGNILERIGHKNEIALLKQKNLIEKEDLFFRLWALKEAHSKYLGCGLQSNFSSHDFSHIISKPDIVQDDGKLSFYTAQKGDLYYAFCVDSPLKPTLT